MPRSRTTSPWSWSRRPDQRPVGRRERRATRRRGGSSSGPRACERATEHPHIAVVAGRLQRLRRQAEPLPQLGRGAHHPRPQGPGATARQRAGRSLQRGQRPPRRASRGRGRRPAEGRAAPDRRRGRRAVRPPRRRHEVEEVAAGEIVWGDDHGVTCRRWNWRRDTAPSSPTTRRARSSSSTGSAGSSSTSCDRGAEELATSCSTAGRAARIDKVERRAPERDPKEAHG